MEGVLATVLMLMTLFDLSVNLVLHFTVHKGENAKKMGIGRAYPPHVKVLNSFMTVAGGSRVGVSVWGL